MALAERIRTTDTRRLLIDGQEVKWRLLRSPKATKQQATRLGCRATGADSSIACTASPIRAEWQTHLVPGRRVEGAGRAFAGLARTEQSCHRARRDHDHLQARQQD